MKKTIVFSLLLMTLLSKAQNLVTDTSASVAGFWNNKETQTLNIKRTTTKYTDNKKTDEASYSYDVRLNILDSTEQGYTMEWTYKILTATDLKNSLNPLDALMDGLRVVYKTDENGSFVKLVNFPEIQRTVNKSLDVLLQRNADTRYKPVLEQLRKSFITEEAVTTLFLREIQLYHTPYGNIYNLHEKVSYEQELPNAATGEPFPAYTTLELTKLDASKDYCQLVMKMQLDKVKGMNVLKGVVKKLMSGSDIKFQDSDLPNQIDMSDHNEFDVILSSGWLSRAYLKRVVDIMGTKKVEVFEILLKN